MDSRMVRFLKVHHVLTLSTFSDQGSWTAHCFYAFVRDSAALVFTTGPETRHGREMLQNPTVSGGIMLETKMVGKIRGIQLTGKACPCHDTSDKGTPPGGHTLLTWAEARNAYLKRFPFALAAKLDLWILTVDYIKMTDNRLGFGKKIEWTREQVGTGI
jgi:uncharacterized protein YhbP (UPF0306 family)